MGSQSWKSGKAISPFLSDRVTYSTTVLYDICCLPVVMTCVFTALFFGLVNNYLSHTITSNKFTINFIPPTAAACSLRLLLLLLPIYF